MNEMKAYIGADEMVELIQKARGFRSYRDLYNRRINDLENSISNLKDAQQHVKVIFPLLD
jgi:intraflagellar transport protein 81